MQKFISILLLFLSITLWGQKNPKELVINKIVHDFELVFENSGVQTAVLRVVNPLKLNIVEKRTIVQGPAYSATQPKSDYLPFQYVRVFMVNE